MRGPAAGTKLAGLVTGRCGTIPCVKTDFVPALELNAAFYREVIAHLVGPVPHAAALLGWGSDVLGYDTPRSTDHGWGPRLQVFVADTEVASVRQSIEAGLPETFRGWPVRYGWDEADVASHVEVTTLGDWLQAQLGVDPRAGLSSIDWLTIPQQRLLGVVRGAVYADPDGELATVRSLLAWYPHDVWLWMLGSQWKRLAQEEPFVGRTAEVGDDLGSHLLAGRLVRDVMCAAFLLSRRYWPYTKWFGTAFSELPGVGELPAVLRRAVTADDYPTRESALVEAYEFIAHWHNSLQITVEVEPRARFFHERPFRVLGADRFAEACRAAISDPVLQQLPLVGSVDQFADSTDVLSQVTRTRYLREFYEKLAG